MQLYKQLDSSIVLQLFQALQIESAMHILKKKKIKYFKNKLSLKRRKVTEQNLIEWILAMLHKYLVNEICIFNTVQLFNFIKYTIYLNLYKSVC